MGVISFQPIQEGTGTASPENIRIIRPALHLDGIGDVGGGEIDTVSGLMTVTDYVFVITKDTNYEFLNNMHLPKAAIILPYNGANRNIVAYSHGEVGTRSTSTRNYQQRDRASSLPYSGLCTYVLIGYPSTIEGESSNWREWLAIQGSIQVWYKLAVPIEYQLTTVQLNQALSQLGVPISSMQEVMHQIAMDTPHLITLAPAALHTFSTNMVAPLKECKIHFEPVQEGEGDPSPENVRPITGRTGIDLYRFGKNLIDQEKCVVGKFINSGGTTTSTSGWLYTNQMIPVIPGKTYHITGNDAGSSASARHLFYKKDLTDLLMIIAASGNNTFVAPDGAYYVGLSIKNTHPEQCQLEFGSASTTVEQYKGQTIALDWSSTLGEIPGGYIDLVRGVAVREYSIIVMDGTTGLYNSAYKFTGKSSASTFLAYYARTKSPRPTNDTNGWLCNISPVTSWTENISLYPTTDRILFSQFYQSSNGYNEPRLIFPADSGIDTLAKANQYLADMYAAGTPVVYSYPLANPITYQLDPVTLKTLRGINNIWSNANGNIDLAYWTH